jgi:pyridinium-3,5-biscarboxylic acid mononucleotide sulfurtransferase
MSVTEVQPEAAHDKLAQLNTLLRSQRSTVVAFSGGADSALLAFCAHQELGQRALAVTADSASLARSELAEAIDFARRFGLRHQVVTTWELEDDRYIRNAGDRCYFCKSALMDALESIVAVAGEGQILLGINVDDLGDYRPGQAAVQERRGRCPMVEVGLSKAEIRWLSRELGLPTWDKPAAACLSSRIAYGVPVTPEALRRIEAAERVLAASGLSGSTRVRDQGGGLARIEVEPRQFELVMGRRARIVEGLKQAGFTFVTLDLEGYRMGSHNRALGRMLPVVDVRAEGTR